MLCVQDKVVANSTKTDGCLLSKEDKCENVAILADNVNTRQFEIEDLHTFWRQRRKKASGSMPYSAVDPSQGIQWKTKGGSWLAEGRICLTI